MARPLVVVRGIGEADAQALAEQWRTAVPELDFEAVRDSRALLKALDAQRATAVVVRVGQGEPPPPVVAEVRRKYPTIALLVLECDNSACDRPQAELCADESSRSLVFLREDVLRAARGRLTGVALSSVLQVLQIELRTCALRVRSGRKVGRLVVRSGRLVHAEYRDQAPHAAALEMLGWASADVVFELAPAQETPTITAPLDFLILEAARLSDEHGHSGGRLESVRPSPQSASLATWQLPPTLRDGGVSLLEEVLQIPGALAVAIVEVATQTQIAHRLTEGAEVGAPERLSAIVRCVYDLIEDGDTLDRFNEIIVNLSTRFIVVRSLPGDPNIVVCVTLDHRSITVGFAKTMLAQVVDAFASAPATSDA